MKKPKSPKVKCDKTPINVPGRVSGDGEVLAQLFGQGHARPIHEQVGLKRKTSRELREELAKYGY